MQTRIGFLKTLDYMKRLPDDFLEDIGQSMEEMSAPSGAVIFREGEEGDALYIVMNGKLSIERNGITLVVRGSGELVGEFALIDDHTRSATVVAKSEARLLKWQREDFKNALARNVELVRNILSAITEKLRQSTEDHYVSLQFVQPSTAESMVLPGNDWAPEKHIIFQSEAMREIASLIRKIAHSTISVLITGESGVGKEMIARAIHHTSPYANGLFVALNCGALPETLAESELFGHERGSFTGAAREQKGKIELAHHGTLFLDEIGEMPPSLQVKFLRVLDDGRVLRLGGSRPITTSFRVIAATNRDIGEEIEKGRFREDLYYRLAVLSIELPGLRYRPDDILPLAQRFLEETTASSRVSKRFNAEAAEYLINQPWSGNVRELRNAVERAVALSTGEWIGPADLRGLDLPYKGRPLASSAARLEALFHRLNLQDTPVNLLELVEMALVDLAMNQTRGNMSQAARMLGINYKQVARRLQKYEQPQNEE